MNGSLGADVTTPVSSTRAKNRSQARSTPVLVVAVLLVLGAFHLAPAEDDVVARLDSGRLSVRTRGEVPVARILEVIGRETGTEIRIEPGLSTGRLELSTEEMELARAYRELVAKIPGAGGHTIVYAEGEDGEPARIARVTIFGAAGGSPPGGGTGEAGSDSARGEAGVETERVEASAPSPEELERQRQRLVERGVSEDTARTFVELTGEAARLRRTPGAAEELYESERYRQMIREIAEAQGKGTDTGEP